MIRGRKLKQLKGRDARVLYRRYEIMRHCWGDKGDDRISKLLKDYAIYRYGGKMLLSKSESDPETGFEARYHPTFNELMDEIDEARESANSKDKVLLNALKKFYLSSDLHEFFT